MIINRAKDYLNTVIITSIMRSLAGMQPLDSRLNIKWSAFLPSEIRSLHPSARMHSRQSVQSRGLPTTAVGIPGKIIIKVRKKKKKQKKQKNYYYYNYYYY